MTKNTYYIKARRLRNKLALIEYKGSKCEVCGYDRTELVDVFEFHHRDSSQKEFAIGVGMSQGVRNLDVLKREADKCMLLCCRCHREIHALENADERVDMEAKVEWEGRLHGHKGRRPKIVWPSAAELDSMIAESSARAVAKALGVCTMTVWRHRKKITTASL